MTVSVLIPAAGSSTRMGGGKKKEFLPLPSVLYPQNTKSQNSKNNSTVLSCVGEAFLTAFSSKTKNFQFKLLSIIIAIPKGQEKESREAFFVSPKVKDLVLQLGTKVYFVEGGDTRQSSILNALNFLAEHEKPDQVTIHDGARPWVSPELILSVSKQAKEKGASAPIIPCVDTLKVIDTEDSSIVKHLDRSRLGAIQTPQAFDFDLLHKAHKEAAKQGFSSTDDTEIWSEFTGRKVYYCDGEVTNKKITYSIDIQ